LIRNASPRRSQKAARDINLSTGRDAHTSADEAETFLIVNLAA